MSCFEEANIYALMNQALTNIFGQKTKPTLGHYPTRVEQLMGLGFFDKSWLKVADNEYDGAGRPFVSTAELQLLRQWAGPHGYALWRAKEAKNEQR